MHLSEEAAQQALAGEHVGNEIAHMAALYVTRLEPGFRQPFAQRLRETVGEFLALARPVAREITLPAADYRDQSTALSQLASS